MKVQMTQLSVDMLEECVRVNVRAKANAAVIAEYAESYQSGAIMPPLVVFREKGCERYIVADGHHRLAAAKKAGRSTVDVDLREGDETEALKFALQCNAEHGLRRTKADLLYAVGQLMTNKRLSDEYRTHRDRSELMKISERYFQSLLADWRNSKGGSRSEQKAKADAKESAAKHTAPIQPPARVNGSSRPSVQVPRQQATQEQRKVAEQVREAHKREAPRSEPRKATVSAAQKMSFTRMVACSKDLPRPEELIASGANIPWEDIENLHDWTTTLLENR